MWGALSDQRTDLSFTIAAGAVILGCESRGTRDDILLFQIQDFPFRLLLRLEGLRWRYSTPPPHGRLNHCSNCTASDISARTVYKTPSFAVVHFLLFSCGLLIICCLAASVVLLFVFLSLPSNGSLHATIKVLLLSLLLLLLFLEWLRNWQLLKKTSAPWVSEWLLLLHVRHSHWKCTYLTFITY
jgi:hypothetical protein